jgi:hypothetical protein
VNRPEFWCWLTFQPCCLSFFTQFYCPPSVFLGAFGLARGLDSASSSFAAAFSFLGAAFAAAGFAGAAFLAAGFFSAFGAFSTGAATAFGAFGSFGFGAVYVSSSTVTMIFCFGLFVGVYCFVGFGVVAFSSGFFLPMTALRFSSSRLRFLIITLDGCTGTKMLLPSTFSRVKPSM